MTAEEIDALPAGVETDALVSELVMGWKYVKHPRVCINTHWKEVETWLLDDENPASPMGGRMAGSRPPRYSADDDTALELLREWRLWNIQRNENEYSCWIARAVEIFPPVRSAAPTLALAICRAALKCKLKTGA